MRKILNPNRHGMSCHYKVRSNLARLLNRFVRHFGVEIKSCEMLPTRNLLGLRSIRPLTVLDVGANEGQFALGFRSVFPTAKFFSFEPLPSCFEYLKKLSSRDQLWECFNLALGDQIKPAEFHVHVGHTSSSSFLPASEKSYELYPETRSQKTISVQCTTLDKWIESRPEARRQPIVLKMDVQGYETNVLRGAANTLPLIEAVITEVIVENLYDQQSTFVEQAELLAQAGFHFSGVIEHAFENDGNVISFDGVFRRGAA